MPAGIHEKLLSKAHNIKLKNYPGATSEYILDEADHSVKSKPDRVLVHLGTNDITNNVKLLNLVKKVVKKERNSSPNLKNFKNQKWQMEALFYVESMKVVRNIFKKESKKKRKKQGI